MKEREMSCFHAITRQEGPKEKNKAFKKMCTCEFTSKTQSKHQKLMCNCWI